MPAWSRLEHSRIALLGSEIPGSGSDGDARGGLGRSYRDFDITPRSISCSVRRFVCDRVPVASLARDFPAKFFHFLEGLWEVRSPARRVRELLKNLFRLCGWPLSATRVLGQT